MKTTMRAITIIATSLALASCAWLVGKPVDPMPTAIVPARAPAKDGRIVVVLPGRGDDLEGLKRAGIAEAIQQGDPSAEVILAGATLPYYMDGGLVRRLHDQIIGPLQRRGEKNVWIAGASMGGMGALMYEREHPGEVAGLLLMAPYLGDEDLIDEIEEAGGLLRWDPGPAPAELNADNVPREEWRVIRSWKDRPGLARRVWLVCGDEDRFIRSARMIAPLLPQGHFLERRGGHKWVVWNPGATEVGRRSRRQERLQDMSQEMSP